MSVDKTLLSKSLKGVLMDVGITDIPIIDNRATYNPNLAKYFDGKNSMKKFMIIGTNGIIPDPIEEGTIVIRKHTVTPKKHSSLGEKLMETEDPITYYEAGYNHAGATNWVDLDDGKIGELLELRDPNQTDWPSDNWEISWDPNLDKTDMVNKFNRKEVEKARILIGSIAKRSENESTMNHTMLTEERRNFLEIMDSTDGMDLFCSIAMSGGQCGECRDWTQAMLEIMPEFLYKAICNGNVPYACCSDSDQGGVDHCYVTFAPKGTNPTEWYNDPSNIQVFDLWYRDQFDELSEDLHYDDETLTKHGGTLTPQMGYEEIENLGEEDGMKKWLKKIPLEHQNRAKTFLYESQAEILFKSAEKFGKNKVNHFDQKMLKLLESVETKFPEDYLLDIIPPQVSVKSLTYLETWARNLNTRKTVDMDEKQKIIERCTSLRDKLDNYWGHVDSRLNGSEAKQEEKDLRMQAIDQSMHKGIYVKANLQDQWTLTSFESIINNSTSSKDCLAAIDRVTLFYALMNSSDMDNKDIEKQSEYCKRLYQTCCNKVFFPPKGDWQQKVDEKFTQMDTIVKEMITAWNLNRENDMQVTTGFQYR